MVIMILPPTIAILFGTAYSDSVLYSLLLSIPLLFVPLNFLIGKFIIYHSFKKIFAGTSIFKSIFRILLFIGLIPHFKIYGIICTIILNELILLIIFSYWLLKIPISANLYSEITFDQLKDVKIKKLSNKLNGFNIIHVINCDQIIGLSVPVWAKIIGRISFTKFNK